jgi:hypothetical protein
MGIPIYVRTPPHRFHRPQPPSPTFEFIAASLVRFLDTTNQAGFGLRRLAVPTVEAEVRLPGFFFDWSRRSVADYRDVYLHHKSHHLRAAVSHYLGRDPPTDAGAMAEAETSSQILDASLKKDKDLSRTASELQSPHLRDRVGFRKESRVPPDRLCRWSPPRTPW